MAKSYGQKQKILYLAKFFLEETDENHPASMKDILAYLGRAGIEAERKSIYADLEELSLFGFDIITLRDGAAAIFWVSAGFRRRNCAFWWTRSSPPALSPGKKARN